MTLGRLVAILVLLATLLLGVPLFVRTPVWVDVTYHDLSAWNVLHGGAHYRDVFETNLPGMVWMHALLRPIIGWSHEAIRIADLCVIGSVVWMLTRFLGVSVNRRLWFAATAALFYLFETEFIHCQRDSWMLLPAVAALSLRYKSEIESWNGEGNAAPTTRFRVPRLILEGLLWGLAVWIKPHVLVAILPVWLVAARFQTRRQFLRDTAWLIVGGLLAGAGGCVWLVQTDSWSPMWDVLLNWNQEYYSWSWQDTLSKAGMATSYFPPFSLAHLVAVPIGVWSLFRRDPQRALLAALYLGWLSQATFIQKMFDYAHAPPTLLALAVVASYRWPVGPIFFGWCLLGGVLHHAVGRVEPLAGWWDRYPDTTRVVIPAHSGTDPARVKLWARCWYDSSWEFKDRLSFFPEIHCAPHWADLDRVADFLRTQDVRDGDLICWHDSTHPLYVQLGVRPAIRYPHVITAMKFVSRREQIKQETFNSGARFVVSDLVPVMYTADLELPPPPGPCDRLPDGFPDWGAETYPWNQPVVFRSGRYIVHRIDHPRGEIYFPMPGSLWK